MKQSIDGSEGCSHIFLLVGEKTEKKKTSWRKSFRIMQLGWIIFICDTDFLRICLFFYFSITAIEVLYIREKKKKFKNSSAYVASRQSL